MPKTDIFNWVKSKHHYNNLITHIDEDSSIRHITSTGLLKKSVNPQNQAKRSIGESVLSAFFERSTSPHQGQVLLHRRSSTCIASLQGKTVTPKTIASNPKLQLHIISPSCTKILGHLGDKPLRPVPTTGSYLAAAATKASVGRQVELRFRSTKLNSDGPILLCRDTSQMLFLNLAFEVCH
jgi:hypothetical protein